VRRETVGLRSTRDYLHARDNPLHERHIAELDRDAPTKNA
jgi:hypothetical protein